MRTLTRYLFSLALLALLALGWAAAALLNTGLPGVAVMAAATGAAGEAARQLYLDDADL